MNILRDRSMGRGLLLAALLAFSPSLIAEVYGTTPTAARELVLTLASSPRQSGVISTRSANDLQFRVLSGNEVSFARSTGRDYQLQARGGFFWTQVQEVPMDAESVVMTPTLLDDGSVEVSMEIARKSGTATQRYRSTVLARPGEWLQLFGPARTESRSTTVYGTQQVNDDSLYLMIEY